MKSKEVVTTVERVNTDDGRFEPRWMYSILNETLVSIAPTEWQKRRLHRPVVNQRVLFYVQRGEKSFPFDGYFWAIQQPVRVFAICVVRRFTSSSTFTR
eukprot:m.150438 g.150438  ORF g.150438 m.150438 type:complete len:99 (-) comp13283_c0_seq8:323-619(-)